MDINRFQSTRAASQVSGNGIDSRVVKCYYDLVMPGRKFKFDKSLLSVGSLTDKGDEKAFWPKLRSSDSKLSNSSARPFMATMRLPTEFKEFLRLLNSKKVEYLW